MAEKVKFGEVFNKPAKKKLRGRILYAPPHGQSITIRFVGEQQRIYQRWDRTYRSFICYEDKREDAIQRIVSFIIDRADEKIKAFICPATVFQAMGEYGPTHDFKINREGHGLSTKYKVSSLGETSVSEEIEKMVGITSRAYSFADIFIRKIKWEVLDKEPESEAIDDRFEIIDL